MSEGEPLSWASSQPIWIQVVIGLFVFFVVFPLVIFSICALREEVSSWVRVVKSLITPEAICIILIGIFVLFVFLFIILPLLPVRG